MVIKLVAGKINSGDIDIPCDVMIYEYELFASELKEESKGE